MLSKPTTIPDLSGKSTPMGELLRRFWMPALLSAELPERDGRQEDQAPG